MTLNRNCEIARVASLYIAKCLGLLPGRLRKLGFLVVEDLRP